MSVVDRSEDARILLEESDYRLKWARKFEPNTDPRVLCELAHDAIELALNSVIVAAGGRYRSTHDLGILSGQQPARTNRCRRNSAASGNCRGTPEADATRSGGQRAGNR